MMGRVRLSMRHSPLLLLAAALPGCVFESRSAEGTTEAGNPAKLSGIIREQGGRPAARTLVRLVPEAHRPADPVLPWAWEYVDTTTGDGEFSFDGVGPGRYNLEAVDLDAGTRLLLRGVQAGVPDARLQFGALLRCPGAIRVPLQDVPSVSDGFVYLQGTSLARRVEKSQLEIGSLLLDSVPPGFLPPLRFAASSRPPSEDRVLVAAPKVEPGDTLSPGPYGAWAYSRVLRLNTTATGAGLREKLFGFPLLVRITAVEFAFDHAGARGEDIRFSKPDGRPLPFEIETWDPVRGEASIWVVLDTVFANRDYRAMVMHWGKPGTGPASDGPSVFDTLNGFAGVWHFHHDPAGFRPQFLDASGSGNHGTLRGSIGPETRAEGIIGPALRLNGRDGFITTAQSFRNPDVYTIEMWFRTTTDSGGKLMGFGDSDTASSVNRDRQIWMDNLGRLHYGVYGRQASDPEKDTLASAAAYNDGEWHQVTATLSGRGMRLYVDGEELAVDAGTTEGEQMVGYWHIGYDQMWPQWGHFPKSLYFRGEVDEIRLSLRDRSAGWIRLAYQNQLAPGRVLRFE